MSKTTCDVNNVSRLSQLEKFSIYFCTTVHSSLGITFGVYFALFISFLHNGYYTYLLKQFISGYLRTSKRKAKKEARNCWCLLIPWRSCNKARIDGFRYKTKMASVVSSTTETKHLNCISINSYQAQELPIQRLQRPWWRSLRPLVADRWAKCWACRPQADRARARQHRNDQPGA